MKTIYLAGGCFWGIQKYFDQFKGIVSTEVGYANGVGANPTYQQVRSQETGYTETIKIDYDPMIICLSEILDFYFDVIDPTLLNRQGNDVGNNYRTGIYYVDKEDVHIIEYTYDLWQKKLNRSFVVEVLPMYSYYPAEEYHQKYLEKNPNGYCHIPQVKYEISNYVSMSQEERLERKDLFLVGDPKLKGFRKKTSALLLKLNQIDNSNKEERFALFESLFGKVSSGLNVKSDFYCDYGIHIFFGKNVFVNSGCVFNDAGHIYIGDDVLIGPQVGLYAVNHPIDANIRKQGLEYGMDIHIGDGCWIGGHATINPGVSLGKNVVVASGSVVTQSFEDNVMVAGVPARIIKKLP